MKDGRRTWLTRPSTGSTWTRGAIVSVTVQDASDGDTATLPETLIMAAEQVEAVQPEGAGVEEVVADKGYHSDETLVGLGEVGVRSHVSEPERGRRCWQDKKTGETPPEKRAAQKALYANRRRVRGGGVVACNAAEAKWWSVLSRTCMRRAVCVASGCAATTMSASACCSRRPPATFGLLLRRQTGVGTPRSLQGRALSAITV